MPHAIEARRFDSPIGKSNGEEDDEAATMDQGRHPHAEDHAARKDEDKRGQSWSRKSAQDDKWSFCLTAGTLCAANQERQ